MARTNGGCERLSSPQDPDRGIEIRAQRQRNAARTRIVAAVRRLKHELDLIAGQFNGIEAVGQVQVWVEMVAAAFWFP